MDATHPSDRSLRAYGLGKLDDAGSRLIHAHLERCPDCRHRASEVSSDSFLGRFRDARGPSGNSMTAGSPADGSISFPQPRAAVAPPPSETLPPGLADHPDYRVLRELGRGGMGVVYLAHNAIMGRDEVLKVIGRHVIERPGVLERFQNEIRAVARLRHPNIVAAYSAFRLDGGLALALEYVDGLDLARLVRAKGPQAVPHAAFFAHQAALGLQHAHDRGTVHRDIKPHNLMLTHDGKSRLVKVLDFGLAKATREGKVDGGLTSEGQALGTPDYIAPEQIVNAPDVDIRADLYSLGATLYYLLTGRPPFQGSSLYDVYQAHMSREADPLNLVRPEVPAELAALVAKLMAKEPDRRFQTPDEVAQALIPFFKSRATRPAAGDRTIITQRPSPARPPARGDATKRGPIEETVEATTVPSSEPAPPEDAETGWDGLIDLGTPAIPSLASSPATSTRSRRSWPGVLVGLLLLGSVAWFAAGIIRARTAEGVIVLENVPEDAEVRLDGEKVTTRWPGLGEPLEITAPAGTRGVEVRKAGFAAFGEVVKVEAGGRGVVVVRLEPNAPSKPAVVPPTPNPRPPVDRRGRIVVGDARWTVEGKELCLYDGDGEQWLVFGDPSWTDYDFSVEAMHESGPSGLTALFRAPDDDRMVLFNCFWFDAKTDLMEYSEVGDRFRPILRDSIPVREVGDERIRPNRWYRLKVEVRGKTARAYRDGRLCFEIDNTPYDSGRVGVRTWRRWKGKTRFRDIKVTAPDGKTLWEGPPDLAESSDRLSETDPARPADATDPAALDGFQSLFNGKDLSGWAAWGSDGPLSRPGTDVIWSVEDGILHGSGARSHLFSPRGDYRDFRVRAEVKINDGGNSGLYFRTSMGPGMPAGYEAQINSTHPDPNRTGSLYRVPHPTHRISPSPVPPDTWFLLEAEAVGDHIRVWVDGKLQVDWHDPAKTHTRGHFAIQVHDSRTHVQVRRLQVLDLDEGSRAGADGFVPLFNGEDLSGFVEAGPKGGWRVEGGELAAEGSGDYRRQTYLLTDREYADFLLEFEACLPTGSDSGVVFNATPETATSSPEVNLRNFDEPPGTHPTTGAFRWKELGRGRDYEPPSTEADWKPPPSWNRVAVERRGHALRVLINGRKVQELDLRSFFPRPDAMESLMKTSGRIGLQAHSGSLRFRNIRLKELSPASTTSIFLPLFNGKDLAGWKAHPGQPGNWRVVNGILTGSGPAISHLYTERADFKNIHLRARVRVNDKGNGGIYVRNGFGARRPEPSPRFCDGYEAPINATHPNPFKTGSLFGPDGKVAVGVHESPSPPGHWTDVKIIAEGNRIVVMVDGKVTADFIDPTAGHSSAGHITLLQYQPQTTIEFARIEVKERNASRDADGGKPRGAPPRG